jgi:flavin reductase (DIM6/NTAB) family NADH-FMN oxidoreductase RutF
MILLFKSADFADTFADNTASDFRARLLQKTKFDNAATIALLHLRVPPLEKATLASIYCSATDVTQVGAVEKRLLQVVALEASESAESYLISPPLARGLGSAIVEEIAFSLRGQDEKPIKFGSGPTTLLLQVT